MPDDTRIDRWLCAVRLVKTRPMATQLCDGGHVRVNGNPAKPSTKIRAGDVVHALIAERERIVGSCHRPTGQVESFGHSPT
jgi:ribosome-associated heat shock protein Hsp15